MYRAVAPAFRSVQMNGNHVDNGREQEDGEQRQVQDMPQAKQALVELKGGRLVERGEGLLNESTGGLGIPTPQAPRPFKPLGLPLNVPFRQAAEPGLEA